LEELKTLKALFGASFLAAPAHSSPAKSRESFNLLTSPDPSKLAMQMLFRIGRFPVLVVLRLIIQLFLNNMLHPRLSDYLQNLQRVPGRSERRKEPGTPLPKTLPPPPEKPPPPKHNATQKNSQPIKGKEPPQELRSKIHAHLHPSNPKQQRNLFG
jgi:hypothetical protein